MALIDTDVLIDYLRDEKKAVDYLEKVHEPLFISVITVAELYAGVKGKEEENVLTSFLRLFEMISLNSTIAELGGRFRQLYGKSHGTGLADALIAATAISCKVTLVTLNVRHFPMVNNILSPYKK